MKENIELMIQQVMQGDSSSAQSSLDKILSQKAAIALQTMKQHVGAGMFKESSEVVNEDTMVQAPYAKQKKKKQSQPVSQHVEPEQK